MTQSILEKIRQRRLQLLAHSYIYYELDQNIVSDSKWIQWAKELVELQNKYPQEAKEVVYNDQFQAFDGSTGAFFMYDDFIIYRANYLLNMCMHKPVKSIKTKGRRKLF